MHELVKGNEPSWSPSGQWIAYVDPSEHRIRLVHPDGTGDHVVKDIGSFFTERGFGGAPVWSPDETKLLLNTYKGANLDSQDVMLLDLKSGKTTRKSHNGDLISSWAAQDR